VQDAAARAPRQLEMSRLLHHHRRQPARFDVAVSAEHAYGQVSCWRACKNRVVCLSMSGHPRSHDVQDENPGIVYPTRRSASIPPPQSER
jgi:hypothetical protein